MTETELSVCPRCHGTGRVVSAHVQACAACDGTGRVGPDYVTGYEEGRRIGCILRAADVTKAVQRALENCP